MGKCTYCDKNAGMFRSKHGECQKLHDSALNEILGRATDSATGDADIEDVPAKIKLLASESFVTDTEVRATLVQGFERAVDLILDDHSVSKEEEEHLNAYANVFGLAPDELDRNGASDRVAKGVVLRKTAEGQISTRPDVADDLPFNFQKSGECVWVFYDVDFFEETTRTRFEGGSTGISVRVARGLYVRQSAFRGHPVVTSELSHLDSGMLALTTKHLYFAGSRKSHRSPYTKIVSFHPHSDGIGVQRDAARAKPQIYTLEDGWFAFNLVRNLARF